MGVFYATVEELKSSADVAATAVADAQMRRALESASRSIDGRRPGGGRLGRRFYPEVATRYFSRPTSSPQPLTRVLLGRYELISADTVVSGGTTLSPSAYVLGPRNDGPPYDRIDLVSTSYSAWPLGTGVDAIVIAGTWGYNLDEAAAGTVAEALDLTETGVDVSDSSKIGVGTIIRVDTERMIVTDRSLITTGQNLQTPLTAFNNDDLVAVVTGSAYTAGETIVLDSETMLITGVAGNTLTVKRAYDGSTLDTHTASTIYAPRTLTVQRGALGTTAATHLTAAPLFRHLVPSLVASLCLAEAGHQLAQESSDYAQAISAGDGQSTVLGIGLRDIRNDAEQAYRRRTTWLGV